MHMTRPGTHIRKLAAISLVAVWAVSTIAAFWWFEFRNLRPFLDEQAVMFRAADLGRHLAQELPPTTDNLPVLLHFWDPGCPCARFSTPHVQDLIAARAGNGLKVVIMIPDASLAPAAREHFGPEAGVILAEGIDPVSSPSAALLDDSGQLAYFGPWSTGANCTVADGGFVESALDALSRGQNPQQVNTLAVGCFCRWPTPEQGHNTRVTS